MPPLSSTSMPPSLRIADLPAEAPAADSRHRAERGSTALEDWLTATLTAACLADRGRVVDVDLHDPQCPIPADADATAQAVLMLLANACRYSASGTRLRLTSRVQWADGADHLVISVCDRGIPSRPDRNRSRRDGILKSFGFSRWRTENRPSLARDSGRLD